MSPWNMDRSGKQTWSNFPTVGAVHTSSLPARWAAGRTLAGGLHPVAQFGLVTGRFGARYIPPQASQEV
jgi:hypothetical protein